jgi:acyl carrier protein
MNDVRTRLARCFASVFPDVPTVKLETASSITLPEWDSLATVTLVAVMEEEFHVSIPVEDIDNLLSFENCLKYLER